MTIVSCTLNYKLIYISLLIEKNPNFIEKVRLKVHTGNKKVKG